MVAGANGSSEIFESSFVERQALIEKSLAALNVAHRVKQTAGPRLKCQLQASD
jgi:hypothetical protein